MHIQGYAHFGGTHPDAAAVKNLLAFSGAIAPHSGEPLTEAAVIGIAGGIGAGYSFCPSVLRYGMGGGVSIVARNLALTFDGTFHKRVFERLGLAFDVFEANSLAAAHEKLVLALEAGKPALAWCAKLLSYFDGDYGYGLLGYSAWSVVVHGIDAASETAQLADLAPSSMTATLESLAAARNKVSTHKNRLLTMPKAKSIPADVLKRAMLDGIRSCIDAQKKPRIKTFSLDGIELLAKTIDNPHSKQGWPQIFAGGRMYWPLKELFGTVETEGTGGGLMRSMYADFLDEAAEATGKKRLRECAQNYRALATAWTSFAEAALPDHVKPFKQTKKLLRDERNAFVGEGEKGLPAMAKAHGELEKIEKQMLAEFPLDAQATLVHLGSLRARIEALVVQERSALAALEKAIA